MSSARSGSNQMSLSIGARITLWGAGATLLVAVAACAVLYTGMFLALRHEVDSFLIGEVHEFLVTVNQHPNDDHGLEQAIRKELGVRTRRDLAFRLFDAGGRLIVTSDANDPLLALASGVAVWDGDPAEFHLATVLPPGHKYPYRVCSRSVTTATGRKCIAQASYFLDQVNESLATVRLICGAVIVTVFIGAVFVGRFLARRSLRPVQLITSTAEHIGVRGLNERIPLAGTNDEMDRLAATLNRMLDRIESFVKQMQQFTADASHELRTPLAALRGNAEVLLSRPRQVGELVEAIENSVELYAYLQRIADDLLLLARLDAGENILRLEPMRIDMALSDVVDLYGPVAEEKSVELRAQIEKTMTVHGDPARLRQLLGNLVDNAVKYTDANGRVSVALAAKNGHAQITVLDTGIGIPEKELPRVFDRFYRVDPARTARSGAGLGLAICKSVVRAHGGQIGITSTHCEGTCVTVSLPSMEAATRDTADRSDDSFTDSRETG